VQLRGVIVTNHTPLIPFRLCASSPSRLRSGASSFAVTDCAVTGTTEIINMTTVMMIPHFIFLSVVLFIVLSPSMVCSACQERNSEEKEKVLFFWAMTHYNASTFPDIGKTCLHLFRSGVKIQGVEEPVFEFRLRFF
jgi:hypothetical protein